MIDGTPATLTAGIAKGSYAAAHRDWETIHTLGTGIIAGLASTVSLSGNAASATDTQVTSNDSQTVGQQLSFAVTADSTYTVTKYVGVATAQVRGKTQGTQDELTFRPVRARYVRVQITAATYGAPPMLEEITVPGGKHP